MAEYACRRSPGASADAGSIPAASITPGNPARFAGHDDFPAVAVLGIQPQQADAGGAGIGNQRLSWDSVLAELVSRGVIELGHPEMSS